MDSIFHRFESANNTSIIDVTLLESISRLSVLEGDAIIMDPDLEIPDDLYRNSCQRELKDLYLFQSQLISFLLDR